MSTLSIVANLVAEVDSAGMANPLKLSLTPLYASIILPLSYNESKLFVMFQSETSPT